jgi:Fis family transcriptional regulator
MSTELADCVRRTLNRYFRDLDGEKPHAIYAMVIGCVEKPMLEVVLKQAQGNQSVAAEMLGISRSTLRRKLSEHNLSARSEP